MEKALYLILTIVFLAENLHAQTNTFPSSGDVGIGTTTPSEKLSITGTGSIGAEIATDGAASSRSFLGFVRSPDYWHIGMNMNLGNSSDFHFRYNGSSFPFTIQASSGNVGIGIHNPVNKLHVSSSSQVERINIQGSLANSNIGFMVMNQDGTERWSMASIYDRDYLQFYRNGYGNVMILRDNGNVGIGTSSPNENSRSMAPSMGKRLR